MEPLVSRLRGEYESLQNDLLFWETDLQDSILGYNMFWADKQFWLGIRDLSHGIAPGTSSGEPRVDVVIKTFKTTALFADYMIEQADLHMADQLEAIDKDLDNITELTEKRNAKWREYAQRDSELREKKKRLKEVEEQLDVMGRELMFPALGREE
ncbi:MAG: hypothetical protein M1376_17015 [Planctomycetes bacterium]|nr:hypothetical protein [Planctomycetota bacterium]